MRFVRAYTLSDTGELVNVTEQETPFDLAGLAGPAGEPVTLEPHDLGLAENFTPSDPETPRPCSPARHLFARMERTPAQDRATHGQFRAKAGHQLPVILDCPVTREGILQRLRERGAGGIPERAAHWLEFMGVFTPDEMDEAGLPRLTLTRAWEFDAMRRERDPSAGSRADWFKAEALAHIAKRAARKGGGG